MVMILVMRIMMVIIFGHGDHDGHDYGQGHDRQGGDADHGHDGCLQTSLF